MQAETDPVVVAALAAGNNTGLRDWYSGDAVPAYWIYRKSVPVREVAIAVNLQNMVDITATDKDRALAIFTIRNLSGDEGGGAFNGEVASDRSAWDDVFSSAAGDESQQAIAALWTRAATNFEKVFALSTGSGADAANADTTELQDVLTLQDIRDAVALIP
jgi:hypothetical protein